MQIKTTDGAIQIDGNEFIPKGTFKAWVDDLDRLNITALIVSNSLIVPTLFSYIEIDGVTYSDLELFKNKIGQSFFKSAAGGGGITPEEKAKVDSLRTNGDGTKYLADDGVYKAVSGLTPEQTNKVNAIHLTGDSNKYLSEDGLYKIPIAPIEIGSVAPTDTEPTVDGIYRAKIAGTYTNLGGLIAKDGFVTWFNKVGAVWALYSEVAVEANNDSYFDWVSNTLADAILAVPTDIRVSKFVLKFNVDGVRQSYMYMGLYYSDLDWNLADSWLNLDKQNEYETKYFLSKPDLRNSQAGKSINASGVVVDSAPTNYVTDFIEVTDYMKITTTWGGRIVMYDASKVQTSTALMYSGVLLNPTNVNNAFIRVGYSNDQIAINLGCTAVTSTIPQVPVRHVQVFRKYDRLYNLSELEYSRATLDTQTNVIANTKIFPINYGDTICSLALNTDIIDRTASNSFYLHIYDENDVFIRRETALGVLYINNTSWKKARIVFSSLSYIVSKVISKSNTKVITPKSQWVAIGDSITDDNVATIGYAKLTASSRNMSLNNIATSGNTSGHQLTKINNFDFSKYDIATICIGTNDYGYSIELAIFKANLQAIIDKILSTNTACKIVLFTLFKRIDVINTTPNATSATWAQYNQAIRDVALENGVLLLDIDAVCQMNLRLPNFRALYGTDGLHPNNLGHKTFTYPLVNDILGKIIT